MSTATAKPKKKRSFADLMARYKTYDPAVEGYGDPFEWSQAFHERMGFEEAQAIIRDHKTGKGPHTILGVSKTATFEEIKKAYRARAMQVHPDHATANGMTVEEATAAFREVQAAYTILSQQAQWSAPAPKPSPTPTPRPSPAPGTGAWSPQLLNPITEAEARAYANSSEWMMQEKHDGERHTLQRVDGIISATNKAAKEIPTTPDIALALSSKILPFRVDGELVNGIFYAFDLLLMDGRDVSSLPFKERIVLLEKWLPQSPCVKYVPAFSCDESLIDRLKVRGAEGVVFKRANAPHTPGRPYTGGDHLKFKFVTTASFIVIEQNGDKRSVALALLDESGAEVYIGSCSVLGNQPLPPAGSIVEVRYLYAYRGGCIYQPAYLGQRTDVAREECVMTQLKYKGEGE